MFSAHDQGDIHPWDHGAEAGVTGTYKEGGRHTARSESCRAEGCPGRRCIRSQAVPFQGRQPVPRFRAASERAPTGSFRLIAPLGRVAPRAAFTVSVHNALRAYPVRDRAPDP